MFEKTRTLLAVYRARDPRGLTAADTLFRAPGFHAVLAAFTRSSRTAPRTSARCRAGGV